MNPLEASQGQKQLFFPFSQILSGGTKREEDREEGKGKGREQRVVGFK